MRYQSTYWALAFVLLTASSSFAKDKNEQDARRFTELGSKSNESNAHAAGTVTTFDDNDIRMWGYYTLAELANVTPGYSMFTLFGERVFETRGQKAGSFNNNKHVVLVDGIPIDNARATMAQTEYQLPLFMASQVEMLRGPAATLWGPRAFFGAINIQSKDATQDGFSGAGLVSYGNNLPGHVSRNMVNGNYKGKWGETKLHLSYFHHATTEATVGDDKNTDHMFYDFQSSAYARLSHKLTQGPVKGLSAGIFYLRKANALGESWMGFASPNNELLWESTIPYLRYERELTQWLGVNTYVKGNISREKGTVNVKKENPQFTGCDSSSWSCYDIYIYNLEYLGELAFKLHKTANLLVGFTFDTRKSIQDLVETDYINHYSTYSLLTKDFSLFSGLQFSAGLRYDRGESLTNQFDTVGYRLGATQRLWDWLSVKLLYSEGHRAPGIKEVDLNKEAINSLEEKSQTTDLVRDLASEKIESYEASLWYTTKPVEAGLTYFYNRTTNALDGMQYLGENIFRNSPGVIESAGIEFDLRAAFLKSWHVLANASYATAVTANGTEFADVPTWRGNLGLNHTLRVPIKLSTSLMGRYTQGYRVGVTNKDHMDGYFEMDAKVAYRFLKRYAVELQGRNLLGSEYRLPNGGQAYNPLPGRSIMLNLHGEI